MDGVTIVQDTDLGAAVAEAVKGHMSGLAKLSDVDQHLADLEKRLTAKPAETPEANLEAGALSTVTGFKVQELPVGAVALGGFLAIFGTELIDGVLAKQTMTTKALAKAAGAFAVLKWGKGLGGAKNWVAGLMLFDALRDATPIDKWANDLANTVSGIIPSGGLGDQRGGNVIRQANEVAGMAGAGGQYPGINRRVG